MEIPYIYINNYRKYLIESNNKMFAKVKYLLAIGFLFLIPACVTGQATGASTVDIDATVEARLAIIPTPTPQDRKSVV